jgi:hypothetical protein
MKFLKSSCQKAWLFDIKQEANVLRAGFACFLAGCESEISFLIKEQEVVALVPSKAANTVLATRIINARLPILPSPSK